MAKAAKALHLVAGSLALFLSTITAAQAAQDQPFKFAGDLQVYLGVMPAAVLRARPDPGHEATMHDGPPAGSDEYHIVVALFDRATGQRIEDAAVDAQVSGIGLSGVRKPLEPMSVAGAVTYGGYFEMSGPDRYSVKLWIKRAGSNKPVQTEFFYQTEIR